MIHKYKIVP